MSGSVTLTLRGPFDGHLRMDAFQPQQLAEMSEREIAAITVAVGRRQLPLGELFIVQGERSPQARLVGSTSQLHGLGAGMLGGELVIDGDAGGDVGVGMAGGTIHVRGNTADGAGAGMSGGLLRIDGDAGDRVGAGLPGASKGMTGGEIVVLGTAGRETGARARRGLIVVAGTAGPDTGRAMIAGSVVVLGACGENAGRGNKRGSIVACGSVEIPSTYRYACTFRPPHVRLTLVYLKRRYGLPIATSLVGGVYRRYCGDAGDRGKGEILHLVRDV